MLSFLVQYILQYQFFNAAPQLFQPSFGNFGFNNQPAFGSFGGFNFKNLPKATVRLATSHSPSTVETQFGKYIYCNMS